MEGKKVIGVNQRTGETVTFDSYSQAAHYIRSGINGAGEISRCVNGTKPSCEYRGWKWYPYEEDFKLPETPSLF